MVEARVDVRKLQQFLMGQQFSASQAMCSRCSFTIVLTSKLTERLHFGIIGALGYLFVVMFCHILIMNCEMINNYRERVRVGYNCRRVSSGLQNVFVRLGYGIFVNFGFHTSLILSKWVSSKEIP